MPAQRWAPPWERAARRVRISVSPPHGETPLEGVPKLAAERGRLQVERPEVGRMGALVGSGVVTTAEAITDPEPSRPW